MKKGWIRYLAAGLVGAILVVSFFWVSYLIQARKVYRLSVATLLSSYKENLLVFIKKYDNHVVFLSGKVYHVSEQDPENYVLLQGTEYIGSYIQMIDPNFKTEKTASEYQENSVRCAIDNKYLTLFEESQYSEKIVTIKGTLHVNTTEVILKDCTKVDN
jgi:hypothetical protein